MILKHRGTCEDDIKELKRLLALPISVKQKSLIELELKSIQAGVNGEKNSAYYIDFSYKDSKNWMIIHNLRLEHRGISAQIDHLLINRFLSVYVLESKNYYYGVKITEKGEFLRWTGSTYQGSESPIEQNKRHIELLKKIIDEKGIAPTRFGFTIAPAFKSYVLVSPNSRIDRPPASKFNSDVVVKSDALISEIDKEIDKEFDNTPISSLTSIAKIVSSETVEQFGNKLVRLHKPININYAAKFGIDKNTQEALKEKPEMSLKKKTDNVCDNCGAQVENKVVFFCRLNKNRERFGRQVLCISCQKKVAST